MTTPFRHVYLDCEFLPARLDLAGLVSIGITDDQGRDYYAVNADMAQGAVYNQRTPEGTYWMRDNVWCHLPTLDRPWKLDLTHPDVRGIPQIAADVLDYFAAHPVERTILYAHKGGQDIGRLHSLWDHDWSRMPEEIPRWFQDDMGLRAFVGFPEVPEQQGPLHHALHDARYDRLVHEHLLALGAPAVPNPAAA